MEEINTDDAPSSIGPFSQAIRDGDRIFVSGQGPVDPETSEIVDETVKAQTERTLRNIEIILTAAGSSLDDVVKSTVFVRDMADYDTINGVYATWFDSPYPARSAVEVADLPIEIDVEIEVIASLRGGTE